MDILCLSDPERDESGVDWPGIILIDFDSDFAIAWSDE